ncbi:MAG: metallopeptidase family protein [Candidatus Pacebacteria bacterium]|jgi:predicted Zn-dependent protease with MMP-like domain|nr:metallopeptidase family protein [Candidatus Paceibacterota bacterium]MDD3072227.1 metallopeptidase family protein [Candidatus Paceibacterota bacterium]MDD3729054.1 metallopeptidase family protein [Candidatus Paceibacterota bacterium]MDD4201184.1 metallopeptidase family protein [Candidatus Paceibacterota bacterium]MDD4467300.1 metallopeptidase family protein [Candidatus Paceibacterota bacterium]
MEDKEFEKLVRQGIELIPQKFLEKMDNVEICIEDSPNKEQLKELGMRRGDFLFGLYEGIPKTERWGYGLSLPDKITIFKKPIEKYARNSEEIKETVKKTIWHEIAHHFGFDEEKVNILEKRKFKKKR